MPKTNYRATLAKRRADVSTMFDGVAERYDLANDVMTMGQVRIWRRAVINAVGAERGQRVLDLGAGTGTSSRPFADNGAMVVPTDLSLGMLRTGKERNPDLSFVAADGLALPYSDQAFDAVTISYALRNVEHTVDALAEMRRVTKPGGRLVIAEMSTPVFAPIRFAYEKIVLPALPPVISTVASNPDAYVYLAESIMAWPDQRGLAALIEQAGWTDIAWQNLSGGIVAVHRAVAP